MAEAKKPEKKDPGQATVGILTEIIAIALGLYLVSRILASFNSHTSGTVSSSGRFSSFQAFFDSIGLGDLFSSTASTYVFFASLLSMLFIFGIIYILFRMHAMEKAWEKSLSVLPKSFAEGKPKNARWERVVAHISSQNPSDWRLAILECDIILDELLDKEGYVGNTIGDKLKNADPSEFRTLNNAWEAHKIRNAIAHEGQDFTLTQREARRIVALYETVFREFDFIDVHDIPPERANA